MEVTCRDENCIELFCCIIRPGSYFGEVSLIYDSVRTANVVAKNYCTAAELDKEHFKKVKKKFPLIVK